MKKVLVLCTGNSCRSQIAEGYLRHFANGQMEIFSAGIEAHGINPRAIAIMAEDGIDISHQTSDLISVYASINFDYVITVCDHAKEQCPAFPSGAQQFHHNFPDPSKITGTEDDIMKAFRAVRNEVREYCYEFFSKKDHGDSQRILFG
ncbi:MAG: arsenate reductase ArsC [Chitinophagaceae bacterium]|nr:MAG: arsenate reductase ArsC [Chitinophagaceae bacterium]